MSKSDIFVYTFLLTVIFLFLVYVIYSQMELSNKNKVKLISYTASEPKWVDTKKEQVNVLQKDLSQSQSLEQQCQKELFYLKQQTLSGNKNNETSNFLEKIYNPIISPNRFYINRNELQTNYQLIGFVYNDVSRYPLYGRYKESRRIDKWEYYVIDETRNRLKIPFETRGYNELMDEEVIDIPALGNNYKVKLYDYETIRYNPDVF